MLPDDHPGHLGHHRRAAEDPQGPRFLSHQPLLGAERLHADVRWSAPSRSPCGRPPGPAPHAHGRHLAVHRRIAGGRARAVGGVAAGRAGRAGSRRGDRRAVDARAADDDVPRGSRAHEGARVLQRRGRRRRQRRPRAGRCPHRLAVVALGAVHQRADRPRGDPAGPAVPAGDAAARRALRSHGCRDFDARNDRARLRLRARGCGRLGRPRHGGVLHRRRGAARRLRPHRGSGRAADHAAPSVRESPSHGRVRRARAGHGRHVLDVLLPHAVPAGRGGLHRARGRDGVPADDRGDVRAWVAPCRDSRRASAAAVS